MVTSHMETVTVDRISNSGNPIAQQQHAGKSIHVPAGDIGDTLEVQLIDKGGYFIARLVDRADEVEPRQPSVSSTATVSDSAGNLGTKSNSQSHSFTIRTSPAGGRSGSSSGRQARARMSRRKK